MYLTCDTMHTWHIWHVTSNLACIFGGRMRPLAPGRSSADAPRRRSADEPWAQFDRWALGAVWPMSPGRSLTDEPWAQYEQWALGAIWPMACAINLFTNSLALVTTHYCSLVDACCCLFCVYIYKSISRTGNTDSAASLYSVCHGRERWLIMNYNWDIVASICGFS